MKKRRANQIRCFISYSHDLKPEWLKLLLDWINSLENGRFDFVYDGDYPFGVDFDEYVAKQIEEKSIDCIFVFFSPKYKEDVRLHRDTGVTAQYSIILGVNQDNKNAISSADRILIKPFLAIGTKDEAIPKEFENSEYVNISEYHMIASDKNGGILSEEFTKHTKSEVKTCLDEAIAFVNAKSPEQIETEEEVVQEMHMNLPTTNSDDLSVLLTKAEEYSIPSNLFVKTKPYLKVLDSQNCILVGRKGSGKTTVLQTLSKIKGSDLKGVICLNVEEQGLEKAYSQLTTDPLGADINNFWDMRSILKMLWTGVFYLHVMYILVKEHEGNHIILDEQKRKMPVISGSLYNILGISNTKEMADNSSVGQVFYTTCLTSLVDFLSDIIQKSRNNRLYGVDISKNASVTNFLNYLIGKNIDKQIRYVLSRCTRRILVTLDGFDEDYEVFRLKTNRAIQSESRHDRVSFEIDWLSSLLKTLTELKNRTPTFKKSIIFALTLPVDRVLELQQHNRDFYKYQESLVPLRWSGIELAILIRKRLEMLSHYQCASEEPHEKLIEIIKSRFPRLPQTITIKTDTGNIELPLFLYYLRMSFWRPRDIMKYYYKVIANIRLAPPRVKRPIQNIVLQRFAKDSAYDIINSEFLAEFSHTFPDLKKYISDCFSGGKQVLSYSELFSSMKKSTLVNSDGTVIEDFHEKILYLYEMGFLGFLVPEKSRDRHAILCKYAFIFNEGTTPLKALESKEICNYDFIIHPIFVEYLALAENYPEWICDYSWDYLYDSEDVLMTSSFFDPRNMCAYTVAADSEASSTEAKEEKPSIKASFGKGKGRTIQREDRRQDAKGDSLLERKAISGINRELFQWAEGSALYRLALGSADPEQELLAQALGPNETERYVGSYKLMQVIWSRRPALGLMPDYEQLADQEYAGNYYSKYRDHLSHMFKVFLLGLYLYENHARIREAISHVLTTAEDFLSVWILTALYHDVGYLIETEDGCWDSEAGKFVLQRFNDALALPLTHLFPAEFGPGTEAVLRKKVGQNPPSELGQADVEEMMESFVGFGAAVRLSPHLDVNPIKIYYNYVSQRHAGRVYYDHGIVSACMLLYMRQSMVEYLRGSESMPLYSEQADKRDGFLAVAEQNDGYAKTAAHAIALHNIQKYWDETQAAELTKRGVTISEFRIPLDGLPIAYLLRLCDELQCWDRQRFTSPLGDVRPPAKSDKLSLICDSSPFSVSIKDADCKNAVESALDGLLMPFKEVIELVD